MIRGYIVNMQVLHYEKADSFRLAMMHPVSRRILMKRSSMRPKIVISDKMEVLSFVMHLLKLLAMGKVMKVKHLISQKFYKI